MLEQGLYALLTSDAGLTALIGANGVWPVSVPETATYPCVSYQVVSGVPDPALDASAEENTRIQFDAWGTRYADVKAVQQALRNILDNFSGTLNEGTVVKGTFRIVSVDNFEQDGRMFRSMSEYRFIT